MTDRSALPPIGGYILTGQLATHHAAHASVILRHDLTADFFGIEERAAGWPGFRSFNVFPITPAALDRSALGFEIDTGHSAFGWIPRLKAYLPQLGLPAAQPPVFATRAERNEYRAASPNRALHVVA